MSNPSPSIKKNIFKQQKQKQIFSIKNKEFKELKKHHDVRQDKRALERARMSVHQPATQNIMMRPQGLSNNPARLKKHNEQKRKTVHLSLWVKPIVKEHLARLAEGGGLTVSSAGAALLERALQNNIDMQYGALIEPVIERAITKNLRQRDTRLISLLVRIAFDSGQTRSIVTNILGMQPEVTPELLRQILVESDRRAKLNITRKTPQMTELMENLCKLFFEQSKEEEVN